MSIQIFVTGGTFDKEYDEFEQKLVLRQTHIPEMLELSRCHLRYEIKTLMLMDSLLMTDEDRQAILKECQSCKYERIVITHGTDTMVTTAAVLGKAALKKTIVFTGAMVPYQVGASDGLFNLGSALAFAQSLPHGVYLAMNGSYFNFDNVRKNVQSGRFEALRAE